MIESETAMSSFDEYLGRLQGKLSFVIINSLPELLSEDMQQELLTKTPDKTAEAVLAAIKEIESGSIERMEPLIKKYLR